MPTVRAFDDPPAGLAVHSAEERRLALLANVWRDPPSTDRRLTIPKRVAFVETAMAWTTHPTAGLQDDRIERRRE
jgi:hypothetical protein